MTVRQRPPGGPSEDEPQADPEAVARAIALRLLTVRARTRHELAEALGRRAVPEEVTARVLERFAEVGLVNDADFAERWVSSRQSRRHLSRQRLRQELRGKGVGGEDIESALSQVDAIDELAAARALGAKKLASLSGADAATRYRRLAGVLGRRGFSSGTIATVLSELLPD